MLRRTIPVSTSITCYLVLYAKLNVFPAGAKTGPITGPPPEVSSETAAALLGAQKNDPLGQHEGGQDGGDKEAGTKVKSEKERMDPT